MCRFTTAQRVLAKLEPPKLKMNQAKTPDLENN